MSEQLDFIFRRRSVRSFTSQKPERDDIIMLLKAAMSAPSAAGRDPWRFIIVDRRDLLNEAADILPNGKMLYESPYAVIAAGDPESAHAKAEGYLIQDCSAAIENILLAAPSLGLGACWLGIYPRQERMEHLRRIFSIPLSIIPVGMIALGYPGEQKEGRSRYTSRYVSSNTWHEAMD